MECRRTVVTGGVLRSPPSVSAAPLSIAANPNVMRHRGRRLSRPYDCGDDIVDEYNNNNNSNVTAVTTINNTTHLIDELEQLRTDNFQLRLRVYNAERRVDRLSAAAIAQDRKKRSDYTDTDSDDSDASSGTDHNNAAAKATAEAAVRTIHDLLTVNRRLLALLAATVSAKAVSVSTDDKRRWQRLRNHIEECAVDDQVKTRILLRFRILYIIGIMIFKIFKMFFFVIYFRERRQTKTKTTNFMTHLRRTPRRRVQRGYCPRSVR